MANGIKSILIQSPTGSGKTALTAHMLQTAASKGMGSFFNVHRRELVKQSMNTFSTIGLEYGVVSAGFMASAHPLVQICAIQTLANRYHGLRRPKLIVWDECHHIAAGTWSKIFKEFKDSFHIGLTATPERLDGKGLADHFQVMVKGPSVRWLIDNKYLSEYKLYAPSKVSLTGVHTKMGDFVKSELTELYDKPTIIGDVIHEYKNRSEGKRAVAFCCSVDHSRHVVETFRLAGITAEHVDGESTEEERDGAIARFRAGETKVLSNVDLFGEGFDLPAIECAILLRPTKSLGLYLQQVGRALRPSPGKTHAIILDHSGNCERHGMPCQNREWTLEGRATNKKKSETTKSVKLCSKCFAAQYPGRLNCQYCNTAFEINSREIEHKDGTLEEVTPEMMAQRKAQKEAEMFSAKTLNDFIALAKKRKYRHPYFWAKIQFSAQQKKRNAGGGR